MSGKFPVDIPPNSNYIPEISDQFPLSSFAVQPSQQTMRDTLTENNVLKNLT
jgi:hypothetical protein